MIKTEAGEKMKKENPNKALPEKADINKDGEFQEWEKARHEAIQAAQAEDKAEMNMGGLMGEGMGVIIGIEAESGNEIPAGSTPEEVADDIPAMLSEGEYVVPADVVRWHGVKTFEELRCEAKMGMGLMAQDGRIAEVDEETRLPVDNDIEEDDKPDVEKAKVKVVHAAEGADVTSATSGGSATPTTYYSYRYALDPETNRYRMVPVDPDTGAVVTSETFDPARSTRYAPRDVLAREVYGRPLGEPEKDETECPEGMVYDEEIGACVPIEQVSVTAPSVGGEGDGATTVGGRVDYASQGLTQIADRLGALSAEDLADVEGDTLSDKAITRMTTPATPVSFSLNPLALGMSVARNVYDDIGARRAALTREQEFTRMLGDLPSRGVADEGVAAYNWNWNPETGSFNPSRASSAVTQVQQREDGGSWVTDFNHIGASGKSYSSDDLFSGDYDPEDPNDPVNDVFTGIENDLKNMTAVSGGGRANQFGSDRGNVSTSDLGGSGGFTGSRGVDEDVGPGGQRSGGDNDRDDRGGRDDDDDDSTSSSSSSDVSAGGGRASGGYRGKGGWNKGGYVTKQNKPKVATMQYSKGSK